MGMKKNEIEELIKANITDAEVEITDLAGDDNHNPANVTSKLFIDKRKVKQHKMEYDALEGRMGGGLHALSLKTEVPKE